MKNSKMNIFLNYISAKIINYSMKTNELGFPSVTIKFLYSEYFARFNFHAINRRNTEKEHYKELVTPG